MIFLRKNKKIQHGHELNYAKTNGFTLLEVFKNFIGRKRNNHPANAGLAGFTLIELLVSIFIIALISGSVMVSYSSGQKQYDVLQTSQKFSANLRQVQNMAISGKKQGTTVPAGYGLFVAGAGQYKLFYNTDASLIHDANSLDLEIINLPANVSLSPANGTIFFVPPDPTTYINGDNSGSLIFTITSGGASKTVAVSSSGLIDIN